MSFEGYYQILCVDGHYCEGDVYNASEPNEDWVCSVCGADCAWWNLVDTTNGSFDEAGDRIDGFVTLERINTPTKCICSACGNEHLNGNFTFKIPENEGHKI